ncbi:V4R domain-containing protein [Crocosphaera sp.]|uniref:V4R domain-containing protein n=1 Tax=Crocosphaera sp. TaxID=2729996 RepID=UPI003F28F8E5|nr:4-vinyl reductase [Crocosphaera sp.]
MNLSVEPIFYTSFSNIGFTPLSSPLISLEIKQFFLKKIVEQYWDSYNPPDADYQGVYILQKSLEETFFGWLYNDVSDDFDRANIPYFICYILLEKLTFSQLNVIWNSLEKGPIEVISRDYPPNNIATLMIPHNDDYQPLRLGINIPQAIKKKTEQALKKEQLMNLFITNDSNITMAEKTNKTKLDSDEVLTLSLVNSQVDKSLFMNPLTIETILKNLLLKPIDIQGIALISQEGQPMITPIGIDEETTSILSGTMLYVAQTTQAELNWQEIETLSIRSQQGYLILAYCTPESYLLLKTGKVLTGLLEAEIGRTVKKIQTILQNSDASFIELIDNPKPIKNTFYLEDKSREEWEAITETNYSLSEQQKNDNFDKELLNMAQNLIDCYPDFVAEVREIDTNPNIDDQQMLKLGNYVGKGLLKQGKIKSVSVKNLVAAINKLIVPSLSYFMIAEGQDNELQVHANPFCLYKTSDVPSCYFLRGMIEGLLASVNNLPEFTVEEITCKATGDESCRFKMI